MIQVDSAELQPRASRSPLVHFIREPYTDPENRQYKKPRVTTHLPITRRQILDSPKLKEFADDNFKFDENGRKLSKQVENTVRNGEIARYEQFLLFPQCFQRVCFPGASKSVILW